MPISKPPDRNWVSIAVAGNSSTVTRISGFSVRNVARHAGMMLMLKVWVAPIRTKPISSRPDPFISRTPSSISLKALVALVTNVSPAVVSLM